MWWRGGLGAAVFMLAAGCSAATPDLEVGPIETAIEMSSKREFSGAELGQAHCPGGRKQKKDDTFLCTLLVDQTTVHFRVKQLDGHGQVARPHLVEQFVRRTDLEPLVSEAVRAQDLVDVDATCGSYPQIFFEGPTVVECTARYAPRVVRHLDVSLSATGSFKAIKFKDALVSLFGVGTKISHELSSKRGHTVFVECGDKQMVYEPGDQFECQGADGLGAPLFPIDVTVLDIDGAISYTPAS